MVSKALRWTDFFAGLILLAIAVLFGPRSPVWYLGMILAAGALPLWVIARLQLGAAFSVRPEARYLVTAGLYSRMRHPTCVFGVWPAAGPACPADLAGAGGVARVDSHRAGKSPARRPGLADAFGPRYAAYRRPTWF
jgi:hypothetical protein